MIAGLDGSAQHPFDSTSRDTGWTVVGKGKSYTPGRIDVGHRLQLRVSVRSTLLTLRPRMQCVVVRNS